MTFPSTLLKGRLTKEVTAWCGLCERSQPTCTSENWSAGTILRERGWQQTAAHGWLCPTCVKK